MYYAARTFLCLTFYACPGSEDEETTGDKRLRRDVSQLVAVMAKQGMLTDRQRLFLLAQVRTLRFDCNPGIGAVFRR